MDFGRLINMAVNIVTRRLINFGINKGIDLASRGGKSAAGGAAQQRDAREIAKKARKAARITRRMGR